MFLGDVIFLCLYQVAWTLSSFILFDLLILIINQIRNLGLLRA